jgi:hypothetical protein
MMGTIVSVLWPAAIMLSPFIIGFSIMAVQGTARAARERLQWARAVREVIRTDSQMLGDAFRLSAAHFQALNELRKLGGRR